jgi:hypothetical protein
VEEDEMEGAEMNKTIMRSVEKGKCKERQNFCVSSPSLCCSDRGKSADILLFGYEVNTAVTVKDMLARF